MTFESDGMKVTQPLEPYQCPQYSETVDDNMDTNLLDHLYTPNIGKQVGYINPIAYVSISWRSFQSMYEDSEVALNNWQQGRYDNFSRCCITIISVR
jgi:hypothetical protein